MRTRERWIKDVTGRTQPTDLLLLCCVENEANTYYDTKRVMKRAFESDWAYSRIESLLIGDSAELERVHSVMQKNFRFLHELFRYESTQEAVGNDLRIPLMGWFGF